MKLLAFGYGYSARVLAHKLIQKGWSVTGTTRSPDKKDGSGVTLVQWNDVESLAVDDFTHILVSVAPNERGDPTLNIFKQKIINSDKIKWIGYLSTTGVYGNHDGAWVNEQTPVTPTTERGRWRVEAEAQWLNLYQKHKMPVHVFRLAGIYGAERGPFEKIRSNAARCIIKENQVFSRIHVEDIASTLEASIQKPNPGQIYNVCDDAPAPPEDVLTYAAQLLGYPAPPTVLFEDADLSPMARSFYSDSKKVSNHLIKTELSVHLAYPDYQSGLNAILEGKSA